MSFSASALLGKLQLTPVTPPPRTAPLPAGAAAGAVPALLPLSAAGTAAIVAAAGQLTLTDQSALYDTLTQQPGGKAALQHDLFEASWMGIGLGVLLGVGGVYAYHHFRG